MNDRQCVMFAPSFIVVVNTEVPTDSQTIDVDTLLRLWYVTIITKTRPKFNLQQKAVNGSLLIEYLKTLRKQRLHLCLETTRLGFNFKLCA